MQFWSDDLIEDLTGLAEQFQSVMNELKRVGDVSVTLPVQSLQRDQLALTHLLKRFQSNL